MVQVNFYGRSLVIYRIFPLVNKTHEEIQTNCDSVRLPTPSLLFMRLSGPSSLVPIGDLFPFLFCLKLRDFILGLYSVRNAQMGIFLLLRCGVRSLFITASFLRLPRADCGVCSSPSRRGSVCGSNNWRRYKRRKEFIAVMRLSCSLSSNMHSQCFL